VVDTCSSCVGTKHSRGTLIWLCLTSIATAQHESNSAFD
jgi:hypothetical protein